MTIGTIIDNILNSICEFIESYYEHIIDICDSQIVYDSEKTKNEEFIDEESRDEIYIDIPNCNKNNSLYPDKFEIITVYHT